ncbi:hypothetical protein ACN4EG_21855 [Alkalinema pantanalense CENA528]|uniref:hypothetical protein n=1 Tax=Alkalinema pantanalense TaxID=1620705 RepID=UPI003D6E0022
MLDEYNLSHAVRGRRHQAKVGLDLPGVQFLTNSKGQKTAVLLSLEVYDELWRSTVSQFTNLPDVQFLIDERNETRSVLLDFAHHLPLWQTLYDQIIQTVPGYNSDRVKG